MTATIHSAHRLIPLASRIGLLTLLALAGPSSTSVITQTEIAKLLVPAVVRDGRPYSSYFGNAIAVDDDTVIVGAYGDCEVDWDAGAAHIFVREATGEWEEQAKLLAFDGEYADFLGQKVDIDGDTVIVSGSDPEDSIPAYIFVRDELGQWTLQDTLWASRTYWPDYFGVDVAIDGDTALVGAPGPDDDDGAEPPAKPGRVYVYVRDAPGVWTEQAQLFASDPEPNDFFGSYLDLDGNTAIVNKGLRMFCVVACDGNEPSPAYIFARDNSGLWTEKARIFGSLLTPETRTGPVAIHEDTAFMITWEPNVANSHVYVFARDSLGNWAEESVITSATSYLDIDLAGSRIVLSYEGGADVYTKTTSGWNLSAKLVASDIEATDYGFGRSVAIADDTVFVGAPGYDPSGAAYIYALEPPAIVALDDGPYVLDEGGALAEDVNILDNDTDPEEDQLTPVVVEPPAHAAFFQVMPDGTFDYTHDGSETTSDTFTYRASDGVNESEIATVFLEITPVNDAPQIRLIGDVTITLAAGDVFEDPGATAHDPEDGSISASIIVGGDTVDTNVEGTYVLTYNVTDSDGSAATEVVRTVIVAIDHPPVITLIGPATLTLQVGDTYIEQGATAEDPEDGELTDQIIIDGTVDTVAPGMYTVTYTVADSAANQAQAQRTVIVQQAPSPPPTRTDGGGGGGGAVSPFELLASMLMMLAIGRRQRRSASGR